MATCSRHFKTHYLALGAILIMRLFIDFSKKPSPCSLLFYPDGSFGQSEDMPILDYEINLSFSGHIELLALKENGICYCLQGFSWEEFFVAKEGELLINNQMEGCICFALDAEDPTEWGTNYGKEYKLNLVDKKRKLALYGDMPNGAEIMNFANGQFVCLFQNEIVGFIVDFSNLSF